MCNQIEPPTNNENKPIFLPLTYAGIPDIIKIILNNNGIKEVVKLGRLCKEWDKYIRINILHIPQARELFCKENLRPPLPGPMELPYHLNDIRKVIFTDRQNQIFQMNGKIQQVSKKSPLIPNVLFNVGLSVQLVGKFQSLFFFSCNGHLQANNCESGQVFQLNVINIIQKFTYNTSISKKIALEASRVIGVFPTVAQNTFICVTDKATIFRWKLHTQECEKIGEWDVDSPDYVPTRVDAGYFNNELVLNVATPEGCVAFIINMETEEGCKIFTSGNDCRMHLCNKFAVFSNSKNSDYFRIYNIHQKGKFVTPNFRTDPLAKKLYDLDGSEFVGGNENILVFRFFNYAYDTHPKHGYNYHPYVGYYSICAQTGNYLHYELMNFDKDEYDKRRSDDKSINFFNDQQCYVVDHTLVLVNNANMQLNLYQLPNFKLFLSLNLPELHSDFKDLDTRSPIHFVHDKLTQDSVLYRARILDIHYENEELTILYQYKHSNAKAELKTLVFSPPVKQPPAVPLLPQIKQPAPKVNPAPKTKNTPKPIPKKTIANALSNLFNKLILPAFRWFLSLFHSKT